MKLNASRMSVQGSKLGTVPNEVAMCDDAIETTARHGRPYKCIVLLGPPGVGKGTQGRRIAGLLHAFHFSLGDLYRSFPKRIYLGEALASYAATAATVPDHYAVARS